MRSNASHSPQSVQNEWKGMVMARELYALLITVAFCLPVNPGNAASYVRPTLAGEVVNTTRSMHTKQVSIDTLIMRQKNFFMWVSCGQVVNVML